MLISKAVVLNNFPIFVHLIAFKKKYFVYRKFKEMHIADVFGKIYRENRWGSAESVSGTGSELAKTKVVRKELPGIIERIDAKSMLDIPCGDYGWMKEVDLSAIEHYTGSDIVPELTSQNQRIYGKPGVSFETLNIIQDTLPTVDLILCRDLFIHFSNADIFKAIANIKRSGSGYLLTTTYRSFKINYDIITGSAHEIDLEKAPFNFPEAMEYMTEDDDPEFDRSLGLWKISQLPDFPQA